MKRSLILVLGALMALLSIGTIGAQASGATPGCPATGSLTLTKVADKSTYNIGDIVTFTITVTANTCNASMVKVDDALPLGLTVSSPSVLHKTFTSIPAGTSAVYSFQAIAQANGTLTNTATATGSALGNTEPTPDQFEHGCKEEGPDSAMYSCPVSASGSATITVVTPQPSPGPSGPPGPPGSPAPSGGTVTTVQSSGSVPGLPNTGLAL